MNRAIRLFCGLGLSVLLAPSAAFSAPPKGAVKLPNSKVVKKDGFFCGNVRSSTWVPGRRIAGGYFYSYQAERTNLRGQLKGASKSKRTKLRAKIGGLSELIAARTGQCLAGGGGSTGGGKALRFDFSGAVGLALANSTSAATLVSAKSSAQSNLKKVDSAGRQTELVSSGSASIGNFLIAPNDKIYVLFSGGTNIDDTSETGACLLAEVDKNTGVPGCIESNAAVQWGDSSSVFPLKNPAIQFDDAGAIYYLATKSGTTVLRKYNSGTTTDLINDNITVSNFLVLSDGRVLLSGNTNSTQARWLRRISTGGALTNLYTGSFATFIKQFPDGNMYIGSDGFTGFGYGVNIYLSSSDTVDAKAYIADDSANPYFSRSLICNDQTYPSGFCSSTGGIVKGIHRTTSQKVFAIAGQGTDGTLMQYYPTLSRPTTVVAKASVFQGVINHLVIAGLNASNKNVMILFDTSDNSEIELIGPSNEIEVYHINYVASSNKIMFDGLRFSDNKYVIGQYDLNTMSFSASQTGGTKLVDFQTF